MTLTKCIFSHCWLRLCQMQANISPLDLEQTFYRLTYSPTPFYFPLGHSCQTLDCNLNQACTYVTCNEKKTMYVNGLLDQGQRDHISQPFCLFPISWITETFFQSIFLFALLEGVDRGGGGGTGIEGAESGVEGAESGLEGAGSGGRGGGKRGKWGRGSGKIGGRIFFLLEN